MLAGAKSFREIGDHAADLPQDVLARLDGRPHPLLRRITVPSETRIRTLVHAIGADALDDLVGGWLRALVEAGRLDGLLRAIAIDGKWLRGVADGQVKLFAAMLHEEKVIIAQHRIPDETTETTQVKELLDAVDLDNAVVTADAAHTQRETAQYIAGSKDDGNRGWRLLPVPQGKPADPAGRGLRRHPTRRPPRPGPHGTGPRPWSDHPPLHLGHRRRGPGLPARVPGGADPPRPLRPRRHPDQQGNRARRHQPERRPRHGRGPRKDRPRPVGHRIGALATRHHLRRRRQYRICREWSAGHGHLQEHRGQPAPHRRRHRDHPHPPGHRTRPNPPTQLPTDMRPVSQTTLPIP
ncbi:MAG: ISAs1 family transposase [Actinobacteria bacterium]|nr:ISAs1 family transposase [Actinomycetota bacterium]